MFDGINVKSATAVQLVEQVLPTHSKALRSLTLQDVLANFAKLPVEIEQHVRSWYFATDFTEIEVEPLQSFLQKYAQPDSIAQWLPTLANIEHALLQFEDSLLSYEH